MGSEQTLWAQILTATTIDDIFEEDAAEMQAFLESG